MRGSEAAAFASREAAKRRVGFENAGGRRREGIDAVEAASSAGLSKKVGVAAAWSSKESMASAGLSKKVGVAVAWPSKGAAAFAGLSKKVGVAAAWPSKESVWPSKVAGLFGFSEIFLYIYIAFRSTV